MRPANRLPACLSPRPKPAGQPSPTAQRRTALPMLRTSDSRFLLFFLCFMSMRRISARVSLTGDLARVSSIFRLSVSSRSAFAAAASCEAALRRSYFAHLFVSRVFHIPGTHSLHRHTKDPDITVGEFQELAEMLLTDRDKGSLLLIAARRGAAVPVVWRVAASAAEGRNESNSGENCTATVPRIIGILESLQDIWRPFTGEDSRRQKRSG